LLKKNLDNEVPVPVVISTGTVRVKHFYRCSTVQYSVRQIYQNIKNVPIGNSSVADPDPDPDRILLSSCKNSEKNLDSYYLVTLFDFLSLKNDVNVATKSNKQKIFFYKISFLLAS
jgi:hypothetical protein